MIRFKLLCIELYSISSKVIGCKYYCPIYHQFFPRSKSTSTFNNFVKYQKSEWKSKRTKEIQKKISIEKRDKNFNTKKVSDKALIGNKALVLRAHSVFAKDPASYYFSDMEIDEKILTNSYEILNLPISNFKDILQESPLEDLLLFIFALSKLPKENLNENFWITNEKKFEVLDEVSIKYLGISDSNFKLCFAWYTLLQKHWHINNQNHDMRQSRIRYPKDFLKMAALEIEKNSDDFVKYIKTEKKPQQRFKEIMGNFSKDFNKEELLFLLHIIGLYRNFPGCTIFQNQKYGGFIMPKVMQEKIVQAWPSWNCPEQTLVLESLNICDINLNLSANKSLQKCVKDSFLSLKEEHIYDSTISPVIAFSKVLGKDSRNIPPFDEIETTKMMKKFGPILKNLPEGETTRLLRVVNECRPSGPELQKFLKKWVEESVRPNIKTIKRGKDLMIIVSTLYNLNYHLYNDSSEFGNCILDKVDHVDTSSIDFGSQKISLMNQLARMGVIQESRVSDLLSKVNDFQPFHQQHVDLENLANHGLEFLFSLNTLVRRINQKFDMNEQLSNSHSTFKLAMDLGAIKGLADLDYLIELDFPHYSGTRLNSNIRSKLVEVSATKLIDKFDNDVEKYRRVTYRQFQKFFSYDKVYFGPSIPYHNDVSDIIFCCNHKLHACDIPQDFLSRLKKGSTIEKPPLLSQQHTWYCLFLPKGKSFTQKSTLPGHLTTKVAHLTKMGYKVIVIPPDLNMELAKIGRLEASDVKLLLEQPYITNDKNNYFQIRSNSTSGKSTSMTIGTNAEQFLNCLNDSRTLSKDLKPVDPDNIKEGALYSKEFTSESDSEFSFELVETALNGTRNLKITKKATDSNPIELDIPENKLSYVISEMKKKVSQSEKLKNNIKEKETSQAKTASNDNKESVEKPEKKYLRTVLNTNFGFVRLRDKELKLKLVVDPNVSTMEFINTLKDVKKLVQDLKPLDPNNLSNESLYFKELTSYNDDLKYQFDLTENATGRILKVTQIWSGENIISIDIPTEELIQYNDMFKAIKKKAKRTSEFVTSNGLNIGLTMNKAAIVLNSISFEANQFSKEFSEVIPHCNTLGATSELAEENCYSKEVATDVEEKYRFDLSKNSKGKFLKITRSGFSPVIIPVEALEDINQSIQDLIKKNVNDTKAKQENEIPKDGN